MANINELKRYINYEFSSGCYTGEDYKQFERKYINVIKNMCKDNNWCLVKYDKNHYCFSAFIKGGTENKYVYISISDLPSLVGSLSLVNVGDVVSLKGISLCAIVAIVLNLILPKAKNEVDYKGGFNHYTTLDKLEGDVCELLNELPF